MASSSFYATRADLLSVCAEAEAARPLQYVPGGSFKEGNVASYHSAQEIETLGTAIDSDEMSQPYWLVLDREKKVVVDHDPKRRVGGQYSIVPGRNEGSLELRAGGQRGEKCLILGRLAAIECYQPWNILYRLFRDAMRSRFAQVNGIYVGPEAFDLLKKGWRLTVSERAQAIMDLKKTKAPFRPHLEVWEEETNQPLPERKSIEETWKWLKKEKWGPPFKKKAPFIPDHTPNSDDDELGFSFFRTGLDAVRLDGLSIPRTFFGRSGFELVSFRNTDLSQSRVCWNDWLDCDFTGADLTCCDFRSSTYVGCNFSDAILIGSDFRQATLEECVFTGAIMTGVRMTRWQRHMADFSEEQIKAINWRNGNGPMAPGG